MELKKLTVIEVTAIINSDRDLVSDPDSVAVLNLAQGKACDIMRAVLETLDPNVRVSFAFDLRTTKD